MSVKQIGLRCDVDFGIGLARGVPYLLDVLKRHGMHGTFYVTMGPDGFRQHGNRLGSAAYRKRIRRMNPLGMIKAFGPWYLARQALGIKGTVGLSQPKVLRRIAAEGHELGVHGFDHYWWAEHAFTAGRDELKADMERALHALKGATGQAASAWASPNWRCSRELLQLVDAYGFPYGADTRGASAFFPELGGYRATTPQLPISLPCLHEISDYLDTTDPQAICDEFVRHVRPGYNVWCIHDYYEGVLRRPMFERVVEALVVGGWSLVPVAALARDLNRRDLPVSRVTTARMPGGRGAVSCQQGTGTEATE